MIHHIAASLLTISLFCAPLLAEVKPVTGTFINFFWQDERNNYMNQRDVDMSDPELWATKTAELHEIGVDYLVLVAVANEEKAFYPSNLMDHGFPKGRRSPIDAIMDTADSLGMHVFMSCGHARNQHDHFGDPFVVRRQREMIEELAAIYGKRPSFYGWYLPIEGCMIPWFPDYAAEDLNKVADRARELTPEAKIMISPYGIFAGEVGSQKFADQIYKLKVDIIAYQDEIGCVREECPMRNMKDHFRQLADIHSKCGIELWANVESFTWDRGLNNWYSALIPAAFGRYLSQIVGVSDAGVDRIISFSIVGIFDKPGSTHPIGQPVLSNLAWQNYIDWLAGNRRWKLLESLLREGAPSEDPSDNGWQHYDGTMETIIDLKKKTHIESVAALFLNYRPQDIIIPQSFEILISNDGKRFTHLTTVAYEGWPNNLHDCWSDIIMADGLDARTRFVKVRAVATSGSILCAGIHVNR
ncbi:MAG: DUF4434 domain-containing protein [Bacteroidales bacterium]|nr:DUF4434 domain-containing protein [Bacteroidales bacterium]